MSEIEDHKKRLLLISNSTLYGGGYLGHAEEEIRNFLGAVRRVLFIPFAQRNHDAYAALARQRLAEMDCEDALGLVGFQISPHYLDQDPSSTHMGETQEERINQYIEENHAPVVGLREGTMLRVERATITLKGVTTARIFRRGQAPLEVEPGSNLTELLSFHIDNDTDGEDL
jgi:peptidase E